MKSFTIHKLDAEASKRLEARARREGTSVNRLAKKLLRKALGLEEEPRVDHRSDFLDLFGTWSDEQAAEFDRAVATLPTTPPTSLPRSSCSYVARERRFRSTTSGSPLIAWKRDRP